MTSQDPDFDARLGRAIAAFAEQLQARGGVAGVMRIETSLGGPAALARLAAAERRIAELCAESRSRQEFVWRLPRGGPCDDLQVRAFDAAGALVAEVVVSDSA
jgi:hypothetical protein